MDKAKKAVEEAGGSSKKGSGGKSSGKSSSGKNKGGGSGADKAKKTAKELLK